MQKCGYYKGRSVGQCWYPGLPLFAGQVFSYGKCEGWSCRVQPTPMHHISIACVYMEPLKCAIIRLYSIVFQLTLTLKSQDTCKKLLAPTTLISFILLLASHFNLKYVSIHWISWSKNFSEGFLALVSGGAILRKLWKPPASHITTWIYVDMVALYGSHQ